MALIKCNECGHEVSDKASVCPNCGCPLVKEKICTECGQPIPDNVSECPNCGAPQSQGVLSLPQKNNKKKWQFYAAILIVVSVILYMHHKCQTSTVDTQLTTTERDFSTVEKARQNIEGTIWTYTKVIGEDDTFNLWCRLVFRDGKLLYQAVSPSRGDWGEPTVCDYTIDEERYSNTGERFIAIHWHTSLMGYSFVPATRAIYWKNRNGYKYGTELTMGDCFPWK